MASGGIRVDITYDENLAWGENRNHVFTCTDEADVDISSFAGWTFEWFLIRNFDDAIGLVALTASNLVNIADAAITAVAPTITVPQTTTDWPADGPGMYTAELWRSDSGNEARLWYGKFPISA